MASTKLAGADATWLHMDRPRNHMVVNTVLWFGGDVRLEAIQQAFLARVVSRFEVLRSRPVDPPITLGLVMPRWEPVEVDARDHVFRIRLPEPGDDGALHTYIGREAAQALDHRVPLWQLHLIEGHRDGAAVLLRTHQALADGPALRCVLEQWADGSSWPAPRSDRRLRPRVEWVDRFGIEGVSIGSVKRDAGMLGKLVTGMPSKAAVLGAVLNGVKEVTWTEPVPLAKVKQAGAVAQATVNDIALAVVTAALRRCVEGVSTASRVEAIVPVTVRPRDEPIEPDLGNRFGLVFLPLPIDADDAQVRMLRVKASMDEIKTSREARTVFDALTALGSAPKRGAQAWVDAFARRGSVLVANMPGPDRPVSIASHPVGGMMLWVPSTGPVGLAVSVCSYAGEVRFGVIVDAAVMPDATKLADALETEMRAVTAADAG
jgi:WS/DGAT/MGAT family acyltransferase